MTQQAVSQPKRAKRGSYPPISPEAWSRLVKYLRLAEHHLQDRSAPEPDIRLLADARHGPFVGIEPGLDHEDRPTMFFQKAEGTTQPRNAPPLVVLLIRVHLAFGGGAHPDDNGKGFSHVKLGSGTCKVTLMRLALDAQPGEVVWQKLNVPFRSQDPRNFYKAPVKTPAEGGKTTRFPATGRREMIDYSLGKFRKHHWRSSIAITEEEYLEVLRRIYVAIDATYNATDV